VFHRFCLYLQWNFTGLSCDRVLGVSILIDNPSFHVSFRSKCLSLRLSVSRLYWPLLTGQDIHLYLKPRPKSRLHPNLVQSRIHNIHANHFQFSSLNFLKLKEDKWTAGVVACHVPVFIYEGVSKSLRTESIMAAKLTRMTYRIAIQLHLVAESCVIYSPRSRRPIRKLLNTPSYMLVWNGIPCGWTQPDIRKITLR
jgi:predicted acyltransferase